MAVRNVSFSAAGTLPDSTNFLCSCSSRCATHVSNILSGHSSTGWLQIILATSELAEATDANAAWES